MAPEENALVVSVWRLVALLAVIQTLVAIAMSIIPNPEGTIGAIGYAAMYAGPAMLVAVAVRSRRRGWRLAAGWSSLVLAVFYAAVVIANWTGYSSGQAAFALAVNLPSVAVYLAVWAATVSRAARRGSPQLTPSHHRAAPRP